MQYVALLRAVNVGGTGKLPMKDLKTLCVDAGFHDIETYIASGNVVFAADGSGTEVRQALEIRLEADAGKPVGVLVRSATDMRSLLEANPYANAPGNQVGVVFCEAAPDLAGMKGRADEDITLGDGVIYIWFRNGMGRSRLKLEAMTTGTMRNINTVAKLVEMVEAKAG